MWHVWWTGEMQTEIWYYVSKLFLLPTDAQENCFKSSIKNYTKPAPTCFGVIIIRASSGSVLCELAKVTGLRHLVKIHQCS